MVEHMRFEYVRVLSPLILFNYSFLFSPIKLFGQLFAHIRGMLLLQYVHFEKCIELVVTMELFYTSTWLNYIFYYGIPSRAFQVLQLLVPPLFAVDDKLLVSCMLNHRAILENQVMNANWLDKLVKLTMSFLVKTIPIRRGYYSIKKVKIKRLWHHLSGAMAASDLSLTFPTKVQNLCWPKTISWWHYGLRTLSALLFSLPYALKSCSSTQW